MGLTNASGATAEVPGAFSSAIEAYGLGRLSLAEVRQSLARALEQEPTAAEAMHELLDEELRARTLSIADYGELVGLIGSVVSENVPTEFSEETPAESGTYRVIEEGTLVRDERDWPAVEASDSGPDPDDGTRPFGPDADSTEDLVHEVELPAAGTVLRDRFRLEQEVARGAMGIVYKATDLLKLEANAGDPLVAVKLVSPALAENTSALRAFHIEVASTQHLSHPNIIHVFELDRDGEHHFITMEWLEGESLADLLDRHGNEALPAELADSVITQLCDALVYAHEHDVVHADVKPGNVFVLESGEIKLIDFGIARAEAVDGSSDALTPAYASCERLEHEKPEARDDLFSLACLMYRLLAGRRAFGPLTALEAEAQGAEPLPVAGMDAGRWDALSRALSFRRSDRQRNVREFVAEYCAAPDVERVDEAFDTTSLPIIDTVSDAGREAAPELKPGMQVDVVFDESADDFQETDASVIFESALAEQAEAQEKGSEPQASETDDTDSYEVPAGIAAAAAEAEAADVAAAEQRGLPPRLRFALAAGVILVVAAGFIVMMSGPEAPPAASAPVIQQPQPPQPPQPQLAAAPAEIPAAEIAGAQVAEAEVAEAEFAETEATAETAFAAIASPDIAPPDIAEPRIEESVSDAETRTRTDPEPVAQTAAVAPVEADPATEAVAEPEPEVASESVVAAAAVTAVAATATPGIEAATAPEAEPAVAAELVAEEPTAPAPAGVEAVAADVVAEEVAEAPVVEEAAVEERAVEEADGVGSETVLVAAAEPVPVTDFAVAGFVAADAGDLAIETESVFDPREPVQLSELDFVKYVEPRSPRSGGQRNYDGWVDVEFRVGTDGVTRSIEVTGSSLTPRFESAAMNAVKKWRFEPYIYDGEPVAVYSAVRLRFTN